MCVCVSVCVYVCVCVCVCVCMCVCDLCKCILVAVDELCKALIAPKRQGAVQILIIIITKVCTFMLIHCQYKTLSTPAG